MNTLTEDQKSDIKERAEKGMAYLKELELVPSAFVTSVNTGDDVFGTKIQAYLRDVKYLNKEETNESSEKA